MSTRTRLAGSRLRDFYEDPAVPASSGEDRARRCVRVAGAGSHAVPVMLRPLGRVFCHWLSATSTLLVQARKTLGVWELVHPAGTA